MFKIKTRDDFVIRIAHILACRNLNDIEMLNCVRLAYRELAFPEKELTPRQNALLEKIYTQEK